MPKRSRNEVQKHVHKSVGGKSIMTEIIKFVKGEAPSLWGLNKNDQFFTDNVYLTIYKDLKKKGYQKLRKAVDGWSGLSDHSFIHNSQEIRPILGKWGAKQIKFGSLRLWQRSAGESDLPKGLQEVNLLIDSVDYGLTTPRNTSKKSIYWSYKKNSLGRRYQAIFDLQLNCRGLWGGYSPKVHDSQWCEINQENLNKTFKGATIVGDQHYSKFSKKKDLTFSVIAPVAKPSTRSRQSDQCISQLTKEQVSRNLEIRNIRARVENPFGQIHQKWKSLRHRFQENSLQLDSLVKFAFGVLNRSNL